jgi:aquaporin Z
MPALPRHWREYAMETMELACFMVSALVVTTIVEHPHSAVRQAVASPLQRRAIIGAAMGLTAAAIVYSPWGRRSGAHFNPSVTLTFLRLGRIEPRDALFYIAAQFLGAFAGVSAVTLVLQAIVADPAVNYVATVPGSSGIAVAFAAELAISFGMMSLVLLVSNTPRIAPATGILAACLVAVYITLEAPLSGMSMNPARSLAPALAAGRIKPLWIYFTAPPLGMLLAAELYVRAFGADAVRCAKLHHPPAGRCHFGCHERSAAA